MHCVPLVIYTAIQHRKNFLTHFHNNTFNQWQIASWWMTSGCQNRRRKCDAYIRAQLPNMPLGLVISAILSLAHKEGKITFRTAGKICFFFLLVLLVLIDIDKGTLPGSVQRSGLLSLVVPLENTDLTYGYLVRDIKIQVRNERKSPKLFLFQAKSAAHLHQSLTKRGSWNIEGS